MMYTVGTKDHKSNIEDCEPKEAKRLTQSYKQIASEDKLSITKLRQKILKESAAGRNQQNKSSTYEQLLAAHSMALEGNMLRIGTAFEGRMVRTKSLYSSYSIEIPTRVCTHESVIPFADYWNFQLSADYRNSIEKTLCD